MKAEEAQNLDLHKKVQFLHVLTRRWEKPFEYLVANEQRKQQQQREYDNLKRKYEELEKERNQLENNMREEEAQKLNLDKQVKYLYNLTQKWEKSYKNLAANEQQNQLRQKAYESLKIKYAELEKERNRLESHLEQEKAQKSFVNKQVQNLKSLSQKWEKSYHANLAENEKVNKEQQNSKYQTLFYS